MEFAGFLAQYEKRVTKSVDRPSDYVFGFARSHLNGLKPNQTQCDKFLDLLASEIQHKDVWGAKGGGTRPDGTQRWVKQAARHTALQNIKAYNTAPGQPFFTGIDPHQFAFQLSLRIREPSLINQGQLGMCGANA